MSRVIHRIFPSRWIAVGMICSVLSVPVAAQELLGTAPTENDHMWDCWVSLEWRKVESYSIRCIRDREVIPPDPPPETPAAALLDHVHELIHLGDTQQLDVDIDRGLLTDLYGHLWKIRIHNYPYEDSWQEGRPQSLVRAVLCSLTPNCHVHIQP